MHNIKKLDNIIASNELKEKIKMRALEIKEYQSNKKRFLKYQVAALIALFLVTSKAVYSFTGFELFKGYFGDKTVVVDENVSMNLGSVKNKNMQMTIEGSMSTKDSIVCIISVKELRELDHCLKNKIDYKDYIKVDRGKNKFKNSSSTIRRIKGMDTENKKYFISRFRASSEIKKPMRIYLLNSKDEDDYGLARYVNIPLGKTLDTINIKLNEALYENKALQKKEIEITPISITVYAKDNEMFENKFDSLIYEKEDETEEEELIRELKDYPEVLINFKDGTILEVFSKKNIEGFENCMFNSFNRNIKENKITITANLKEIIDIKLIKNIVVDSVMYEVK